MCSHQGRILFLILIISAFINESYEAEDVDIGLLMSPEGFAYHQNFMDQDEIQDLPKAQASPPEETYDYIIVGAGTSGPIVARRLAEAGYSVLILEAGGHASALNLIPIMAGPLTTYPKHNWNYETTPQKWACQAMKNKQCILWRGKVLGGSSTINQMVFVVGHPSDYNNWAQYTNDPSWNYTNMLPIISRVQNYSRGYWPMSKYHNDSGPIGVSWNDYNPHLEDWKKAGIELGYAWDDYNADVTEVFSAVDKCIRDGKRETGWTAYYDNMKKLDNFVYFIYSEAIKINFNKQRAISVNYLRHGMPRVAKCRREIILSAGSFNSPKLLMLSGIGPADHLTELGIPIIKDLPVGQNMKDHTFLAIGPFMGLKGGLDPLKDIDLEQITKYIKTRGHGILGSSNFEGMYSVYTGSGPDRYFMSKLMGATVFPDWGSNMEGLLNVNPGVLTEWFSKMMGEVAYFVAQAVGMPRSIGWIKLKSADPKDPPLINPNYQSDPQDRADQLYGINFTSQVFAKMGAHISQHPFPLCSHEKVDTQKYWECYMQKFMGSFHHHTSTCKMGKIDDPTAVTTSDLNVIGITGLRVCDASIMPEITSGNTMAPAFFIGEKCSDMIIKDAKDNKPKPIMNA